MENYPSLFSNTLRISHYYQIVHVYMCDICMKKTELLSNQIRAALKPINGPDLALHSIAIEDLIARYMKVFSKSREDIIEHHLPYLPTKFIERNAKGGYLCRDCFVKRNSFLGTVDHGITAPLPNNIELKSGDLYSENVPDPKPISKKAQKLSKKIKNAEKKSSAQKKDEIKLDKRIIFGPVDNLF